MMPSLEESAQILWFFFGSVLCLSLGLKFLALSLWSIPSSILAWLYGFKLIPILTGCEYQSDIDKEAQQREVAHQKSLDCSPRKHMVHLKCLKCEHKFKAWLYDTDDLVCEDCMGECKELKLLAVFRCINPRCGELNKCVYHEEYTVLCNRCDAKCKLVDVEREN